MSCEETQDSRLLDNQLNSKSNLGFNDEYMGVYILEDTKERID